MAFEAEGGADFGPVDFQGRASLRDKAWLVWPIGAVGRGMGGQKWRLTPTAILVGIRFVNGDCVDHELLGEV